MPDCIAGVDNAHYAQGPGRPGMLGGGGRGFLPGILREKDVQYSHMKRFLSPICKRLRGPGIDSKE